jgi:FkbM family methyltransferase
MLGKIVYALLELRLIRFAKNIFKKWGMSPILPITAGDAGIIREIFFKRVYAPYFPFYENAVILDIGAHKGFFALFAARCAGPLSRIIAVEPSPGNFRHMETLLKKNTVSNVTTLQIGVSGVSATAQLYLTGAQNNSLFKDLLFNDKKPSDSITIKTSSLDDLMKSQNLTHIDFMKIDCEGAEYAMLLNAPAEVMRVITTIAVEFHDLRDEKFTALQLLSFFKKHDFTIAKFEYQETIAPSHLGIIIATRK